MINCRKRKTPKALKSAGGRISASNVSSKPSCFMVRKMGMMVSWKGIIIVARNTKKMISRPGN